MEGFEELEEQSEKLQTVAVAVEIRTVAVVEETVVARTDPGRQTEDSLIPEVADQIRAVVAAVVLCCECRSSACQCGNLARAAWGASRVQAQGIQTRQVCSGEAGAVEQVEARLWEPPWQWCQVRPGSSI